MTINFSIRGKPRILIVDLTSNAKGFEYQMSSEVLRKTKEAGVDLAADDVLRPTTDEEYAAVFDPPNLDFNILLLIAHGARDKSDIQASSVVTSGGRSNWYRLASLTSSLRDKLVCLAVCYGLCDDSVDAFVKGGEFALAVVAPTATLSTVEDVAFFPRFFADLRDSSPQSIDPDNVRHFVEQNNGLATNKMKVFSEAATF